MKVRELVAVLQGFDQDMNVEYMDYEWGPCIIEKVYVYPWDDSPTRVVVE